MKDKNKHLSIGIFDSGMGGISVLSELIALMPDERYIYYGDSLNAPYGIKDVDEIVDLSINACDFLISKGVKAIVVACNTATSASIKILRRRYDIPIIGMEPAIKPSIDIAKDKKIVVMATPITLKERKFNDLMIILKISERVIKVPAPELVRIVETGDIKGQIAKGQVDDYFKNIALKDVGAIVLGCTHFVFLRKLIKEVVGPNIPIIDGNFGTAKHLKSILCKQCLLNEGNEQGIRVEIYNSSNDIKMIELSNSLLDYLLKEQ